MDEGTKIPLFGETINHKQDHSVPSICRDPSNEIQRNICPNPCRDGKWFEKSRKECHFTLVVLEGIAFIHHLLNFSFHSLPKEVTSCPLICFHEPRVPCRWRIMEFIADSLLNICALGKHQTTLYLIEEPPQE